MFYVCEVYQWNVGNFCVAQALMYTVFGQFEVHETTAITSINVLYRSEYLLEFIRS